MTAERDLRYDALPVDPAFPAGSSWGLLGDEGTVSRIADDEVLAAASLVRSGRVFPLNWKLELPDPGFFGRNPPAHTVRFDGTATDDEYERFHPQSSTQWDALCHIRHPVHGFYNGARDEETPGAGGTRLDIDRWARRGIVGRFLLLDVAAGRAAAGEPLDPGRRTEVGVEELDRLLAARALEPRRGDILLLRFGWTSWYEGLGEAGRREYASTNRFPSAGLEPGERTARWLWDRGFAAVAGDNPAVEATPIGREFLHSRLIPLLGFAIGELFDLAALAAECTRAGRYEGLFVSAPLRKRRGAGSPANALALM